MARTHLGTEKYHEISNPYIIGGCETISPICKNVQGIKAVTNLGTVKYHEVSEA